MKLLLTLALSFSFFIQYESHAAGAFDVGEFTVADGLAELPGGVGAVLMTALDTMATELETTVNSNQLSDFLTSFSPDVFLKNASNTAVEASTGLGVDYASDFSLALLDVSVGGGIVMPTGGFSAISADNIPSGNVRVSITAGVNAGKFMKQKIGPVDMSKVKLYLSFFTYNLNSMVSDLLDSPGSELGVSSFGMHAQYKLIDSRGFGPVVKWGGVDVTTGIRHTGFGVHVLYDIPDVSSTAAVPGAGNLTSAYAGQVEFDINSSVWTLPMQATSYVRALYFLSFYGGLGVDLNIGSSSAANNVTGNVEVNSDASIDGITELDGENGTLLATAPATLTGVNGSKAPTFMHFRGLFGLQFDLGVMALYGHVTKSFLTDGFGGSVGFKGFW